MASKKPKAQAALEYLITYGWALIALVTIIGVIVMVGPNSVGENTCHASLAFVCKGVTTQDDTVIMKLQNLTAQTITINPYDDIKFDGQSGYAVVIFQGTEYRFEDVTIGPGQEFIIEGQGQVHADQVTITYYAHQTGLTDTETITMNTNFPPEGEISNDGIDNDGDGFTDCAQPGIGPCEYVVSAVSLNPVDGSFDSDTQTISFGQLLDVDGNPITGFWKITKIVLVFDAENVNVGSNAKLTVNARESDNKDIAIELNNLVIVTTSMPMLTPDIPDFVLTLNSGNFTVSEGSAKAILTLKPFP